MAWEGSTRKASLPPDWEWRRGKTFERDGYRCTAIDPNTGERCPERATDCDHKGNRLDHSLENLTSLCSWHHDRKSGTQGAEAQNARRAKVRQRYRRVEKHPGLKA